MNNRVIENDDRGLTINKGLAWTIVSGLVLGGFYVGVTLGDITSSITELKEERAEFREGIQKDIEIQGSKFSTIISRVTMLERSEAADEARLDEIGRVLARVDRSLTDLNRRLRSAEFGEPRP